MTFCIWLNSITIGSFTQDWFILDNMPDRMRMVYVYLFIFQNNKKFSYFIIIIYLKQTVNNNNNNLIEVVGWLLF